MVKKRVSTLHVAKTVFFVGAAVFLCDWAWGTLSNLREAHPDSPRYMYIAIGTVLLLLACGCMTIAVRSVLKKKYLK
jgi:hypothetical protein